MAQPTNVDIQGMVSAQPHFETALSETGSVYNRMSEQAQVLESSWTGDSSVTFVGALNEWLENCNTVKQALQQVTDKLEANTHNYQNVHTNATDSSTTLKQAMSAGLPGF